MAESGLKEFAHDHKCWSAELERWQGCLGIWRQQQATLMQEVEKVITDHGRQLGEHARALDALQRTIADCERAMSMGTHTPSTLQTQHEMDSCLHDQQRTKHEQLKARHHRLMLALSLLKGEPFREE